MWQTYVVVAVAVVLLAVLPLCQALNGTEMKIATACYGNNNNYLRLDCETGYFIHVISVYHAAKLKDSGCIGPFSVDTYRRECCGIQITDCDIMVLDGSRLQCEFQSKCAAMATWSNTNKECDQDKYPPNTSSMRMEYMCMKISEVQPSYVNGTRRLTTPSTTTPTTTTSTSPTSLATSTISSTLSSSLSTTTVTTSSSTIEPKSAVVTNTTLTTLHPVKTASAAGLSDNNRAPPDDELSDVMIGAIVGGCLGMLFTFVVFVFYWGRKRRLRIVGKPQPSVWDYLLSQTFTVRGTKGYDHFSSVRSSASSEGDPNSPVVRKNMWLPNIVDKDDKRSDDVISNYDNDSDRCHRVEIHHNATPSPYAILNLSVSNMYQDTIHEV